MKVDIHKKLLVASGLLEILEKLFGKQGYKRVKIDAYNLVVF